MMFCVIKQRYYYIIVVVYCNVFVSKHTELMFFSVLYLSTVILFDLCDLSAHVLFYLKPLGKKECNNTGSVAMQESWIIEPIVGISTHSCNLFIHVCNTSSLALSNLLF